MEKFISKTIIMRYWPIYFIALITTSISAQDTIITTSISAQDTTIVLDFIHANDSTLQQQLDKRKSFSHNEKYQIVINNINKNIFSINDTVIKEDYNTELPSIFQGIKIPAFLNLSSDDTSEEGPRTPQADSTQTEIDATTTIVQIFNSIAANMQQIVKLDSVNYAIAKSVVKCNVKAESIKSEVESIVNGYIDSGEEYGESQIEALEKYFLRLFDQISTDKKKLSALLAENEKGTERNIRDDLKLIYELELKFEKGTKSLKDYTLYKESLAEIENKRKGLKLLKDRFTALESTFKELSKIKLSSALTEIKKNYALAHSSNFTYKTDVIKASKDVTTIKINISKKAPLLCQIDDQITVKKKIPTRGGWKIDFSTGVFVNSGSEDFLGRDIQYVSIDESNSEIQSKDAGNRRLLAIGGLLHIYKRSEKPVKLALSPGVSSSVNFDALNFHLGFSLLFGNDERVVFSGGLTLRETKILDRNYEFDTPYLKSELPETPPLTNKFPEAGCFISLTYNLSALKSKE